MIDKITEPLQDKFQCLPTGVPRSLKTPPPLGPPYVPRHSPNVGSYGVAFLYERGSPACWELSELLGRNWYTRIGILGMLLIKKHTIYAKARTGIPHS